MAGERSALTTANAVRVDRLESDLVAYDQEAADRAVRPVERPRVAERNHYIELLRTERRTRVLQVGIGPGRDAAVLSGAGAR